MGNEKKIKSQKVPHANVAQDNKPRKVAHKKVSLLPWIAPILLITGICFIPMLSNELTNWDDEYYVVQNNLLRGPDWAGIFSKPVVSNYHPITILTLALNYAMTGLDPSSYLITNLLLHLINTGLVFYFIWLISGRKLWVAAFTAIVFGIHPMHVESVAWISERKDVLYTLFFLLSLIQYWYFLNNKKNKNLVYCFIFFVLSVLSKPAAIVLPLILFLLDYWYGQSFRKNLLLKVPFLLVSVVMAIITVKIQSKTAIAGLDFYPLWSRFFFATYTSMTYIIRFLVPYPLSAFHPYPLPSHLGWPVFISPVFMLGLLVFIWFKRKNKLIVFAFLFFIINLVLVLQVISIGSALVAERYTYLPYIAIAFAIGMLLEKYFRQKLVVRLLVAAVLLLFGIITFQRTKVWKDSETLWTDVLKSFPDAPTPRTNRANYFFRISQQPGNKERATKLLEMALEDCSIAIKAKPTHAKGYENRQNIYLVLNEDSLALADADMLIKLEPHNRLGYYTKGVCYQRFDMKDPSKNYADTALNYFNKCLEINPNTDFALNNRGSLKFNRKQQYDEAIADFTKAISINPLGNYYLNRSKCYYKKGEFEKAKSDAMIAIQKNEPIEPNYRRALNL